MKIKNLTCRDFRNMKEIFLSDFEQMNVIYGENAQGKTNLLEAIWLFTGAKSFRNARDHDFIRFGCDSCRMEIAFISEGIQKEASLLIQEKRTAFLNENRLKATSDLAANFHAVIFSPNDLELIKGGPAARRKFLDLAIGQISPSYIPLIREYYRAVSQRNQIIKEYKYDGSLSVMLEVFEAEIAEKGEKIVHFRKKYLHALKEFLSSFYSGLSGGKETLEMEYQCSCRENLSVEIVNARKIDMMTGTTSVGPHRDDLIFLINGIDARKFGSQGQKRSAALALRLAEAELIKKVTGDIPVFLLDDVMSELDPGRQHYILNHIEGIQTFLTCCDPSDTEGLQKGKIIHLHNGRVV